MSCEEVARAVTIKDASAPLEATFIPELGMIGSSLRHEGEELFGQLGGVAGYEQRGATFALPLLHPWANRLREWGYSLAGQSVTLDRTSPVVKGDPPTVRPIHGLLAASPHWQVVDSAGDHLTAELDFGAVPEYMAAFPFAHRVRYSAALANSALTIALTVIPLGDTAVPIAFGFHPYLTLPGSDRRGWQLELPVARQALLDEQLLPTGEGVEIAPGELDGPFGDRTFDTSFDRLYTTDGEAAGGSAGQATGGGGEAVFALADERRRVEVAFGDAYPVSQVYAAKASDFICYEPMTAPVDPFVAGERLPFAAPGTEFTAEFQIRVSKQ
jgi:galactose mutarotase-like enzyme